MKSHKVDDWFIGRLLEETYSALPDNEVSKGPEDLLAYFELQANSQSYPSSVNALWELCEKHGLFPYRLGPTPRSRAFRACIEGKIIDFPSNWYIFEKLEQAVAEQRPCLLSVFSGDIIGRQFLEVLCPIMPCDPKQLLLINHKKDGAVMVVSDREDIDLRQLIAPLINQDKLIDPLPEAA